MQSLKKILIVLLTLILMCLLIGLTDGYFFAPNRLRKRSVTITDSKIDPALNNMKIIYFSDLKANQYFNQSRINNLVTTIMNQEPDVILFGGGLLDTVNEYSISQEQLDTLKTALSSLKAPFGKFYVSSQIDDVSQQLSHSILEASEFELVDNKLIKLYFKTSYINLFGAGQILDISQDTINRMDFSHYTLAFGHQPSHAVELSSTIMDRYVAGYTHGGQLNIPLFKSVFMKDEPYQKDTQKVQNLTIDISHGVGLTLIDMRLFSDPEIIVYTLESK